MKLLITGAKGFVGRNLIQELKNRGLNEIYEYDRDTEPTLLMEYCSDADFVFHLAGVNRPKDIDEFVKGNTLFTSHLLDTLKRQRNICPVMLSSSIQAQLDNPYGRSKRAGEELVLQYRQETGARVYIYRFPNIFGRWCRPNYNSVIATFCYNIARELPITVNNPETVMRLVYIDDVVEELMNNLAGIENKSGDFCEVSQVYTVTLGEIAERITSFRNCGEACLAADTRTAFVEKLYRTYLSYLPGEQSFTSI